MTSPLPSIFYLRTCYVCNTVKTLEEADIDCPGCSPAIIHRDPGDEDDAQAVRFRRLRHEQEQREEASRQEYAARVTAGLPCGRRVMRHVSARWRDYGPCERKAGHPGRCLETT